MRLTNQCEKNCYKIDLTGFRLVLLQTILLISTKKKKKKEISWKTYTAGSFGLVICQPGQVGNEAAKAVDGKCECSPHS